jgi:RNA polymerase sigma-70 factor (ECF subfamily)
MDFSVLSDMELLAIIAGRQVTLSSDSLLSGAINSLYDRYGRLIYSVAIHTVGDAQTAEEITQDVFVRVWENAHTYQPEVAKVSAWLVSITRHRAIDELRRRKVRPEKNLDDWPEEGEVNGVEMMTPLDGPEKLFETTAQQQSLRQILAALPPDQRQILRLAYFKGLSHSQIAELLGEPLGTVKSRVRLGMQKLREMILAQGIMDP